MEKDGKDTSDLTESGKGTTTSEESDDSALHDTIRAGNIQKVAPPIPNFAPPVPNIDDSNPSNGVDAQGKTNGVKDNANAADTDTSSTKPAFFLANEGKVNLEKKMPPRYPDSISMPAKPATMHTRTVSWGIDSKPLPSSMHSRKISGGTQEVFQDSNTSAWTGKAETADDIQQPFLSDNPVRPIGEHMLYSSANKPKNNGKITVGDVINRSPMEAEAETYILRAVEERDILRYEADSSRVLDNVPDEAINNLASETQNADINSTATSNQFNDRQPSIQSIAVSSRHRPAHHRRSSTVEQKLAGLSDAIGAFHDMEIAVPDYQAPPSPLGRGRLNTYDVAETGPSPLGRGRLNTYDVIEEPEMEPLLTAAEIFQQNASILLKRGKNKNVIADTGAGAGVGIDSSEAPSTTSSKKSSHWTKLRNVVKVMNAAETKKNDDGVIIGGVSELEDEEVGGSPDQGIFVEALGDHEAFEREQGSRNQAPETEKLGNKEKRFFTELEEFFGPRRTPILLYCKIMVVYVFLPVIGVSAVLFHLAGNPPTGILKNGGRSINGTLINEGGAVVDPGSASASWWVSSHIYGRLEIKSAVLSILADPS
jgi:hypothetical protein